MAVTSSLIFRITEGEGGATVLHTIDGRMAVVLRDWVEENRPEVGGFLIADEAPAGRKWFAKSGLETMPAVLAEVMRISAGPDEVVLFKLPPGTSMHSGDMLKRCINQLAPDLPVLVVSGDMEVMIVGAPPAKASAQ